MLIPSEQEFAQAVALWREWNGRINVISRKDEDNIFAHHILHSLAIAQYLELYYPSATGIVHPQISPAVAGNALNDSDLTTCLPLENEGEGCGEVADNQTYGRHDSFLDVGTGGGFPGIPLAMVMPEAKFMLCDSIGKKVKVAQAVAQAVLAAKAIEPEGREVDPTKSEWPFKDFDDLRARVDEADEDLGTDAGNYLQYTTEDFTIKITGESMGMTHTVEAKCYVKDGKVRYYKWCENPIQSGSPAEGR